MSDFDRGLVQLVAREVYFRNVKNFIYGPQIDGKQQELMQWHYVSLRVKIGHLKMPRQRCQLQRLVGHHPQGARINCFGGGVLRGQEPPLNAIAAAN